MRIYKAPGSDYTEIKENYTKTILYCKDEETFHTDFDKAGLVDEEHRMPVVHKTPFVKNKDGELMTYVMLTDEQLVKVQAMKNVEILGDYEEVNNDLTKKQKYYKVYDTKPKQMVDTETNEVYTYTPPAKFGTFGE